METEAKTASSGSFEGLRRTLVTFYKFISEFCVLDTKWKKFSEKFTFYKFKFKTKIEHSTNNVKFLGVVIIIKRKYLLGSYFMSYIIFANRELKLIFLHAFSIMS